LTWPDFRVKGFNARFITDLDGPAQPEVQQVLGARESEEGFAGELAGTLKQLFPASDLRPMARRQMQEQGLSSDENRDEGELQRAPGRAERTVSPDASAP